MVGVHPKVVQTVMRHSSITLTMDTYGHLFPGQEADAIKKLPNMLSASPNDLQATGTDGGGQDIAQQLNGKSSPSVAMGGETTPAEEPPNNHRKSLELTVFGGSRQDVARLDENRPGGIRTPDQGIMSPLL